MIVLRLQFQGRHRDVRACGARVALGAAPGNDVMESEAGWAAHEAEILHRGTDVELRRGGPDGRLRLRVGDSVRLGRARLTLVGLLPLEAGAAAEDTAPGAGPDLFGAYPEVELAGAAGPAAFRLEEPAPAAPARAPREPASGAPARPAAGTAKSGPPPPISTPAPSPAAGKGVVPAPRPPAPAFQRGDFGTELVRQLKRTPFFALSLGLHLVVFLVLSLLQVEDTAGSRDGQGGTLHAALNQSADLLDVTDDEARPDEEIPTPLLPEIPAPRLPDEEAPKQEEESAAADRLEPLPDLEPAPFDLGLNPSLSSVESGTRRAQTGLTRRELGEVFVEGAAKHANQRAADYVRANLGLGNGRRGTALEQMTRQDLLVVEGSFDKIGRVLEALRLPYMSVTPTAIAQPNAPDLSQHKVIFWNCGESLPPDRLLVATRRLRAFVEKGGFLFTTDWSIGNVIALAFPGYLATNGPRAPLPEAVVDIHPVKGLENHALLDGVFPRGAEGRWWLEQATFDIRVLKRREVVVLIESNELQELYGREKAVAVTFEAGRGRVLHVMGHYYQEAGNLAGTISAQRLALNLVLLRLAQDP